MLRKHPCASAGYSLLELLVGCIVVAILTAIAFPTVMRAWRSYQLTSAATQVVGVIKAARSDAVRRNTNVQCRIQQIDGTWWIGEYITENGAPVPTGAQVPLTAGIAFLPDGVAPDTSSMAYPSGAQLPPGFPAGTVGFDGRGGVNFGAGPSVIYVLYIGMEGDPGSGFRAITLVPAGATKVWTSASGGTWHALT